MGKVQFISKVVNSLSIACSIMAMSLFSVIFYRPTNIIDYRNTRIFIESAQYLVIVAVLLFCLAFLLSFFKDSKQNPVSPDQLSMSEEPPLNSYTSNGNNNTKSLNDRLKSSLSNKKDKVVENSKPLITPSKSLLAIVSPKQIETGGRPSNSQIESRNSNKKLSEINKQLVLYTKPQKSLSEQNVPAAFSLQVPNFWKSMSVNKAGDNLATEVTTTRKVTFFPGGFAQSQEDFHIRRTTFFRCPESGISSVETVEKKLVPGNDKFRMDLSMFKEPRINHVPDVLAKFESMNILH